MKPRLLDLDPDGEPSTEAGRELHRYLGAILQPGIEPTMYRSLILDIEDQARSEHAEAWLKANDLYAVTHLHEPPPDCGECNP
jgi:hypothetical protein